MSLEFDKFLDEDEYEALINEVTFKPITRDKLLIQLALATGARASELLNVTKKDLKKKMVKKKTIFLVQIRGLKGSDDREIPISGEMYRGLMGLEGEKLFPITYTRLHQIWQAYAPRIKATSKKVKTFHALRHTFAVRLYKKERDVKLVQMALGHRDLRNTMIYVDYVYKQEHLERALGA